jgi:hypothetical protein
MAVIRKADPVTHVVVVDTNVLWHKDKKHAASPDFDAAWEEAAKLAPLELVVPETVRGELLFQQTASAWKRLDQVMDAFGDISGLTAHEHRSRLDRETVKRQVAEKFDKWLKSHRAIVAPTPFASIPWSEVADAAIWRDPPFTPDPKNPDAEKGFRDAMILHTVIAVVREERRAVNLVFVCDDNVLRRAVVSALTSDERFNAYDDMSGFTSYLKLTKEKLTKAFISAILARADEKFFSGADETSLYVREHIPDRIMTEFQAYFADPARADPSTARFPQDLARFRGWQPSGTGTWWLHRPEFVSVEEEERIYHWKTDIVFTRPYRNALRGAAEQPELFDDAAIVVADRLLTLRFDVFWKARVKADARFYDVTLESTKLAESRFRQPTEEERKAYGFFPPRTA